MASVSKIQCIHLVSTGANVGYCFGDISNRRDGYGWVTMERKSHNRAPTMEMNITGKPSGKLFCLFAIES